MDEPLPLDAPDTPLSLTVQLNVVPATSELKAIDVVCPLHIVWLDGVAIAEGTTIPQFHVSSKKPLLRPPKRINWPVAGS